MAEDKAIVIGSGIGGAAAAAILSSRGFGVTVLERNPFPGGKAASYEREGYICDMGVHYTALGEKGPIGEVARCVSADLRFIKKDPYIRIMKGERFSDLPLKLTGMASSLKLVRLIEVRVKNLLGAYRAFRRLTGARKEQDVEPFDELSLKEFLSSCTDDEELHRMIDTLCGLMLAVSYREASAGEFIWSYSNWAAKASSSYPKGGFRQIAISFLEACTRFRGEVCYQEAARSIRVREGRVLGVETDKGFYPADVVVSNAGLKKTIQLAGEGHFDESYVNWAMALKDSAGGATIKYALDYRPVDIPIVIHYEPGSDFSKNLEDMSQGKVPEDPPLYIPCPTHADPDLAPKGRHLLLVGTIVPASLTYSPLAEKVLDRVEEKVRNIFPGLDDHIVWKHRTNLEYIQRMGGRGAGEVIGLAQTFDQTGKNKPDAKMPIEGLYLVGCDAGSRGIGVDQAADSALKVTEQILRSR